MQKYRDFFESIFPDVDFDEVLRVKAPEDISKKIDLLRKVERFKHPDHDVLGIVIDNTKITQIDV